MDVSPKRSGKPKKIAVFSDHFRSIIGKGGGVDRCQLRLSRHFGQLGYVVDAVAFDGSGWLGQAHGEDINFVILDRSSTAKTRWTVLCNAGFQWHEYMRPFGLRYKFPSSFLYLPSMIEYLRQSQPQMLISAETWQNVAWSMAKKLTGSDVRLIVTQRNHFSSQLNEPKRRYKARRKDMQPLVEKWYDAADHVVAISHDMAEDLKKKANLSAGKMHVIPNPVIDADIDKYMNEPLFHPWVNAGVPLLISVGRLAQRKDHLTLIKAVQRARRRQELRLIIIGDGSDRDIVARAISERGLGDCVELIGYDSNPYRYLARADLFVLPSRYEGFPAVLVEALACGCPAVSTDCPTGPREILEDGRYGMLVPIGDAEAMADAILEMVGQVHDCEGLKSRGRLFSVHVAAEQYLRLGQ